MSIFSPITLQPVWSQSHSPLAQLTSIPLVPKISDYPQGTPKELLSQSDFQWKSWSERDAFCTEGRRLTQRGGCVPGRHTIGAEHRWILKVGNLISFERVLPVYSSTSLCVSLEAGEPQFEDQKPRLGPGLIFFKTPCSQIRTHFPSLRGIFPQHGSFFSGNLTSSYFRDSCFSPCDASKLYFRLTLAASPPTAAHCKCSIPGKLSSIASRLTAPSHSALFTVQTLSTHFCHTCPRVSSSLSCFSFTKTTSYPPNPTLRVQLGSFFPSDERKGNRKSSHLREIPLKDEALS